MAGNDRTTAYPSSHFSHASEFCFSASHLAPAPPPSAATESRPASGATTPSDLSLASDPGRPPLAAERGMRAALEPLSSRAEHGERVALASLSSRAEHGERVALASLSSCGDRFVPAPLSSCGDRFVPAPLSSCGDRFVPAPLSSCGDRFVPAPLSSCGDRFVPAPLSSCGDRATRTPLSSRGERAAPAPLSSRSARLGLPWRDGGEAGGWGDENDGADANLGGEGRRSPLRPGKETFGEGGGQCALPDRCVSGEEDDRSWNRHFDATLAPGAGGKGLDGPSGPRRGGGGGEAQVPRSPRARSTAPSSTESHTHLAYAPSPGALDRRTTHRDPFSSTTPPTPQAPPFFPRSPSSAASRAPSAAASTPPSSSCGSHAPPGASRPPALSPPSASAPPGASRPPALSPPSASAPPGASRPPALSPPSASAPPGASRPPALSPPSASAPPGASRPPARSPPSSSAPSLPSPNALPRWPADAPSPMRYSFVELSPGGASLVGSSTRQAPTDAKERGWGPVRPAMPSAGSPEDSPADGGSPERPSLSSAPPLRRDSPTVSISSLSGSVGAALPLPSPGSVGAALPLLSPGSVAPAMFLPPSGLFAAAPSPLPPPAAVPARTPASVVSTAASRVDPDARARPPDRPRAPAAPLPLSPEPVRSPERPRGAARAGGAEGRRFQRFPTDLADMAAFVAEPCASHDGRAPAPPFRPSSPRRFGAAEEERERGGRGGGGGVEAENGAWEDGAGREWGIREAHERAAAERRGEAANGGGAGGGREEREGGSEERAAEDSAPETLHEAQDPRLAPQAPSPAPLSFVRHLPPPPSSERRPPRPERPETRRRAQSDPPHEGARDAAENSRHAFPPSSAPHRVRRELLGELQGREGEERLGEQGAQRERQQGEAGGRERSEQQQGAGQERSERQQEELGQGHPERQQRQQEQEQESSPFYPSPLPPPTLVSVAMTTPGSGSLPRGSLPPRGDSAARDGSFDRPSQAPFSPLPFPLGETPHTFAVPFGPSPLASAAYASGGAGGTGWTALGGGGAREEGSFPAFLRPGAESRTPLFHHDSRGEGGETPSFHSRPGGDAPPFPYDRAGGGATPFPLAGRLGAFGTPGLGLATPPGLLPTPLPQGDAPTSVTGARGGGDERGWPDQACAPVAPAPPPPPPSEHEKLASSPPSARPSSPLPLERPTDSLMAAFSQSPTGRQRRQRSFSVASTPGKEELRRWELRSGGAGEAEGGGRGEGGGDAFDSEEDARRFHLHRRATPSPHPSLPAAPPSASSAPPLPLPARDSPRAPPPKRARSEEAARPGEGAGRSLSASRSIAPHAPAAGAVPPRLALPPAPSLPPSAPVRLWLEAAVLAASSPPPRAAVERALRDHLRDLSSVTCVAGKLPLPREHPVLRDRVALLEVVRVERGGKLLDRKRSASTPHGEDGEGEEERADGEGKAEEAEGGGEGKAEEAEEREEGKGGGEGEGGEGGATELHAVGGPDGRAPSPLVALPWSVEWSIHLYLLHTGRGAPRIPPGWDRPCGDGGSKGGAEGDEAAELGGGRKRGRGTSSEGSGAVSNDPSSSRNPGPNDPSCSRNPGPNDPSFSLNPSPNDPSFSLNPSPNDPSFSLNPSPNGADRDPLPSSRSALSPPRRLRPLRIRREGGAAGEERGCRSAPPLPLSPPSPPSSPSSPPPFSELPLPHASLLPLWDSLAFESGLPERLERYITSSLALARLGVDPSLVCSNRVVLLHGPPGTGKTSLCRALAQRASARLARQRPRAALLEVRAHALFSRWFGESGKAVDALFDAVEERARGGRAEWGEEEGRGGNGAERREWGEEEGKENGTEGKNDGGELVFLLLDEIESLAAARGGDASGGSGGSGGSGAGGDASGGSGGSGGSGPPAPPGRSSEPLDAVRAVNALLTRLDALRAFPNVVLLATSNLPDALDPAFLDRCDVRARVGRPVPEARYRILTSIFREMTEKGAIDVRRGEGGSKATAQGGKGIETETGAETGAETRAERGTEGGTERDAERGAESPPASLPPTLPLTLRLSFGALPPTFRLARRAARRLEAGGRAQRGVPLPLSSSLLLHLVRAVEATRGLSGRALRRLPLVAHASRDWTPTEDEDDVIAAPLDGFVDALCAAARAERD